MSAAKLSSQEATLNTTASTVNSNVASSLTVADSTSAQRLQSLGLVHQARLAQLTRTAASVTAQYGATSVQATAAEAAVTTSRVTVARLAVLNLQVKTNLPQVADTGWSLYGHIYNAQLQPVSAYTVFFVDEQNAYQSAFGFAYTVSDGSYQLRFSGSPNAAGVPTNPAGTSQLFLQIVNDKAEPVYLSTTPFQPQVGAATYQDVTLPEGEPILGDPPAEIRAIAMPDTTKAQTSTTQSKAKSDKS
jgi:hypothetical protein